MLVLMFPVPPTMQIFMVVNLTAEAQRRRERREKATPAFSCDLLSPRRCSHLSVESITIWCKPAGQVHSDYTDVTIE